MTFRRDTFALTALLGILTALGPLSTDMYLPSLPSLTERLGSTPAEAQLTLSVFLLGFASTQIFYGPLSDRYGRRPVLLVGLAVFIVASALCAVSVSMPMLIAARFLQAVGASGPIVLARAVARDLYSGRRAGQELALMATIMGIVPTLAPTLGGVMEITFGWRSSFIVAAALGLALFALVALRLPETLPASAAEPPTPLGMVRVFGRLVRNWQFVVYVSMVSLCYTTIFTFISVSSYVLQGLYALSPIGFGIAFGLCSLGYICGTLIGRRLSGLHGIDAGIAFGVVLMGVGATAAVILVVTDLGGVYALIAASAVVFAGVGGAMAQSMAGTLMPFPESAGAASSLMGVCQMTLAALTGVVVAAVMDAGVFANGAMPLTVAMAVLSYVTLAIFVLSHATRKAGRVQD